MCEHHVNECGFSFCPTSVISGLPHLPARKYKPACSCDIFIGSSGIWVPMNIAGLYSQTQWSDGSFFVCLCCSENILTISLWRLSMGLVEGKLDLNQCEHHRTAYVGRRLSMILCSVQFEALVLLVVKRLLLLFSFSPLVVFGEHVVVYPHAFGSSHSHTALSQG